MALSLSSLSLSELIFCHSFGKVNTSFMPHFISREVNSKLYRESTSDFLRLLSKNSVAIAFKLFMFLKICTITCAIISNHQKVKIKSLPWNQPRERLSEIERKEVETKERCNNLTHNQGFPRLKPWWTTSVFQFKYCIKLDV